MMSGWSTGGMKNKAPRTRVDLPPLEVPERAWLEEQEDALADWASYAVPVDYSRLFKKGTAKGRAY